MHNIENEREATMMEEEAFAEYEEKLKEVRAFAVISTNDPLERPSRSIRQFHTSWATTLARMASDNCSLALQHAEAVRQGH
jgi:hypothetical protein